MFWFHYCVRRGPSEPVAALQLRLYPLAGYKFRRMHIHRERKDKRTLCSLFLIPFVTYTRVAFAFFVFSLALSLRRFPGLSPRVREIIMELLPHGHVEIPPRRGGSIYASEAQKPASSFILSRACACSRVCSLSRRDCRGGVSPGVENNSTDHRVNYSRLILFRC